jgi:hypothetical protein
MKLAAILILGTAAPTAVNAALLAHEFKGDSPFRRRRGALFDPDRRSRRDRAARDPARGLDSVGGAGERVIKAPSDTSMLIPMLFTGSGD